jgi:hypothetical protein
MMRGQPTLSTEPLGAVELRTHGCPHCGATATVRLVGPQSAEASPCGHTLPPAAFDELEDET